MINNLVRFRGKLTLKKPVLKTGGHTNTVLLLLLFICSGVAAQNGNLVGDPEQKVVYDTIAFHYPYYGKRVPPFLGIVAGYEGYRNNCWEAGIALNMIDTYNPERSNGAIVGFIFTYKQSLENDLKTAEAEAGLYSPFSIGAGFSESFYMGTRTFGFRPFVGTSWYHLQVMLGYNFYSKNRNELAELDNLTVKVRYVLPVVRIFKNRIPNPGNNY